MALENIKNLDSDRNFLSKKNWKSKEKLVLYWTLLKFFLTILLFVFF